MRSELRERRRQFCCFCVVAVTRGWKQCTNCCRLHSAAVYNGAKSALCACCVRRFRSLLRSHAQRALYASAAAAATATATQQSAAFICRCARSPPLLLLPVLSSSRATRKRRQRACARRTQLTAHLSTAGKTPPPSPLQRQRTAAAAAAHTQSAQKHSQRMCAIKRTSVQKHR